jgi:GT2 family glycosyltransferase
MIGSRSSRVEPHSKVRYFRLRIRALLNELATPRALIAQGAIVLAGAAWAWKAGRPALILGTVLLLVVAFLLMSARLSGLERTPAKSVGATTSSTAPKVIRPTGPGSMVRGQSDVIEVTVVVTAHNEADFIEDALASVQAQTFADWECIVIDDASTDEGIDAAYARFGQDERFVFLARRSQQGLAAARNLGLSRAQGEFITFLDGDDYLFPDAIAERLAVLRPGVRDSAWLAGVYCNWMSVRESARLGDVAAPPKTDRRGTVCWLDALYEAPFIASAPLLRVDVMRSVGGFDIGLSSAENFECWTRVLRNGFVLDSVSTTGVAYRQKQRSMFRSTPRSHAEVTLNQLRSNATAIQQAQIVEGAPFVFTEPGHVYELRRAEIRRLIVGLASAIAAADEDARRWLLDALAERWEPWVPQALDSQAVVRSATRRLEADRHDPNQLRAELLATHVHDALEREFAAVAQSGSADVRAVNVVVADPPGLDDVRRLQPRPFRPGLNRELEAIGRGAILFVPAAAYHVLEFGPVAELMAERGLRPLFMASKRRWPSLEHQLRRFDVPAIGGLEPGPWVSELGAVVTLNDWGELTRDLTVAAKEAGVPTFGKIEGVQDFNDDDVGFERNAYQTVDHVLCQGANDVRVITNPSKPVVGGVRLEAIWNGEPRPVGSDLVVVNLNFTYGVLDEARDAWLQSVIEACRLAGRPYIVSAHPAEKARPAGALFSERPMAHLLTEASVLVSRFSTVPFEAMARGVPFVYHNPHGERVPTFHEPDGAFEITTTSLELAGAIKLSNSWQRSYRERCADFFLAQIDVDGNRSSTQRTADIIEQLAGL